jgi:1,4-dihydroxy-2-naphthoate polyprenyltransferase
MSNLKVLLSAARLRTLPLALSCIITGNAIAYYFEAFSTTIFLLSLLTTILLQVLSNFSNDLGDSEKGTDNSERIGPERAIQSGEISINRMKFWIKITAVLALISGVLLIFIANILWWERLIIFGLGLASLWAANNYTRGDVAYGYKAYGDAFVFVFFGLVGVLGALFLSIHKLNNAAILPSIGVGALCVSVLHLNNMRDFINDRNSNKITVAIKLGFENSKIYFILLFLLSILTWASFVFTQNAINYFSFIYWLGFIPLLFILIRFLKIKEYKDYDALLKPTALSCFFISILFFISQIF